MTEHESNDGTIYQRKDGTRYVKSEEFARSEEGRKLLKRFSENVEAEDGT